jgi:hypothetical protein
MLDANKLMDGKSVPIFKLKGMWDLDISPDATTLKDKGITKALTSKVNSFVKDNAQTYTNSTIDYATDKITEQSNIILKEQIGGYCKQLINEEIDKAFKPFEEQIGNVKTHIDSQVNDFKEITSDLDDGIRGKISDMLNESKLIINDYVQNNKDFLSPLENELARTQLDTINKNSESFIEKIKNQNLFTNEVEAFNESKNKVYEKMDIQIQEKKDELSTKIYSQIDSKLNNINEMFVTKITSLSEKSKEQVGKYISNIGGANNSKVSNPLNVIDKSNIRASFLTANYQDYLRIFLLFVNGDTKLNRISDLIELNIRSRKDLKDYKLLNSKTYIRANARIILKYLFMTSKLFPSEFRKKDNDKLNFDFVIYKGF